jgi:mannose-6-phosphate isomerase-like protein (cupin superfamily)
MPGLVTGGCLCGEVRFEVDGPFLRAGHCHCSRCRKHSGAAVCTQARVRREQFRLLCGADRVRVFRPGDGAVKAFCKICGSSLFGGTWPEGEEVSIRMGSLDGDPGIRPQFHTFVDSRAPWDEITDSLPRHPEGWSAAAAAPPPGTPLLKVNLAEKLARFDDAWNPRIVAELNGQQVKLARLRGAFVWHQHEAEDEMFLVLGGTLRMELRESAIVIEPGEFLVVPRGVEHRPVADAEVEVMLFEPATTLNTGDAKDPRARPNLEWI